MTRVYGHRGARGEVAENTVSGFLHAKAAGVFGIETDVAVTADFVPVLHHDPVLADGRLIKDVVWGEMGDVPSLAEALAAVADVDWLLEIKTFADVPGRTHAPAVIAAVVAGVLRQAKVAPSRVRVLAFEWAVLRELRRVAPEFGLVCLSAPEQEAKREAWWGWGFAELSTPAAVARLGAKGWAPHFTGVTAALVDEARGLGLDVLTWTVNEAADFEWVAPLVDGVITDFPERFLGG